MWHHPDLNYGRPCLPKFNPAIMDVSSVGTLSLPLQGGG